MKSTVAAVGLMASLASASAYQPRHFHWRRDNTTASVSAPAGFTTLTVDVTEIATVTSCAPTITNCPARSASLTGTELATFVVTNVVHLTETVCPVTEAEKISKSFVEEHSKGNLPGTTRPATATPTAPAGVPLSTGGGVPGAGVPSNPAGVPSAGVPSQTASAQEPTVTSPPVNGEGDDEDDDCPADEGEVETSVTDIISTKYVTVTVGQGSTASVITSAVETTAKSTVLVTKPAATTPVGGSVTGVTGAEEPTTTTTATSTNTRTVTVKRPAASGTPSTGSGSGNGSGSGSGNSGAEECSCPSAVTVTVPASTVYVTIGGSSAPTSAPVAGSGSGSGSGSGNGAGNGSGNTASPSKTASAQAPATTEAADEGDDECPADEEVVTLSSTVTVAPFPTNGTNGGSAKPTGAAYRRSQKLF